MLNFLLTDIIGGLGAPRNEGIKNSDKITAILVVSLVLIIFATIVCLLIYFLSKDIEPDYTTENSTQKKETPPKENIYENVVFRDRLKELMEVNGETIYTLSDALGVTPGTVLLWIKDDRQPTEEQLYDLASYFGCTREYLYGYKKATIKKDKKEYTESDTSSSILTAYVIILICFVILIVFISSCTGCLNR